MLSLAHPPDAPGAPLGGTRAQRIQRLQIGFAGVTAMLLLVALADVVGNRVQETEASVVPEAAPTTEPSTAPAARDPLAEAGVVPELPGEGPNALENQPSSSPQKNATGDVPPPAKQN